LLYKSRNSLKVALLFWDLKTAAAVGRISLIYTGSSHNLWDYFALKFAWEKIPTCQLIVRGRRRKKTKCSTLYNPQSSGGVQQTGQEHQ
jgi:hypothetical protein